MAGALKWLMRSFAREQRNHGCAPHASRRAPLQHTQHNLKQLLLLLLLLCLLPTALCVTRCLFGLHSPPSRCACTCTRTHTRAGEAMNRCGNMTFAYKA
jgi:hypothetical protein